MRWLQNISFSSQSSSSSSPRRVSSMYADSLDRDRRGFRFHGPKLTRQRKLRHLTDLDVVGDQAAATSSSALARSSSAYSVPSRSPSAALPLPLPLPLPEGDGGDGRHQTGRNVRHGDRDRDRVRADVGAGDRVSFGSHDTRKAAENLDARSHKAAHQDLSSANSSRESYWVNIPTRSAPTSPFASPVVSPHRKSAGDIFPYFNTVSKGNQILPAPEVPFDISGHSPPAFFDYTAFSTDNSPIHSPPNRSPQRQAARSPSHSSSPLHPMLSPDPTSVPRESVSSPLHPRLSVDVSSANVHRLPLPPGAAMPSPSTPAPHVPPKLESVPMTSQWQKGKPIGRGTFGSVYVASNRETGALCAMKEVELFPDDPKSAECIKQLEQEISVLRHLQHPNIVQYYGSETVDDRFYIYIEYVHPGSINKYIREHCGAMTESVVRNFTRHILSGLAYLHSKKTVHRDIKGANLLVDASGVVKLADFGMAKHLTGQRADLSLKGSPYWMAPELMQAVMQKDNSSDLAFAVDIWSLGCTIIEMFTGKPPWSDFEGAAAMFKVMKDTPPIPESLSPEGKDFLRCCFRRNPAERPTAAMLLEHRFVKNWLQPSSPHQDVSQLLHGMQSMDKPNSRRERPDFKLDQLPVLPGSKSTKRVTSSESETGQPRFYHYEPPPDLMMAARNSPRSTLEAIPSPSPPRSAPNTTHRSATTTRVNYGVEKKSVFS